MNLNAVQAGQGTADIQPAPRPAAINEKVDAESIENFLTYTPRPHLEAEFQEDFLARMRRANPQAAEILRDVLFANDASTSEAYRTAIEGGGLGRGFQFRNVGHTLANYNVLCWAIANNKLVELSRGDYDARLPAIRSTYSQVLYNQLEAEGASVKQLQFADEALMLAYVLTVLRLDNALKNPANSQAYGDEIRNQWQANFGVDLRAIALTTRDSPHDDRVARDRQSTGRGRSKSFLVGERTHKLQ